MSGFIPRVLSGYRRLFRARKSLFTGDQRAMIESRTAIRAQFNANKYVTDRTQMEGLLTMVDEAEDMLLNGIMRGELNPNKGHYGESNLVLIFMVCTVKYRPKCIGMIPVYSVSLLFYQITYCRNDKQIPNYVPYFHFRNYAWMRHVFQRGKGKARTCWFHGSW